MIYNDIFEFIIKAYKVFVLKIW